MSGGWYPVALGIDIAPGTVAGTRLFGRSLAVWRDGDGVAHVWEDRCPHRGMRLSFGFVRDGRLACLYHGWRFDGAGRCRFIPAHPALEVPASITVARMPSAEAGGLVWALAGEDAAATVPPVQEPGAVPVRSLAMAAGAERVARVVAALAPPGELQPLLVLQAGPDRVLAAVQPLAPGETCLHLLVAPGLEAPRAAQARVSAWGEALRRSLEAETGA